MTGMRARTGAVAGAALALAMVATAAPASAGPGSGNGSATLIGRAVLPAATFAGGPESGQYIGAGPIGGQPVPFAHQPVQGFSALLPVRGSSGDYWALTDNGYGSEENSADAQLRIYRIRPDLVGPKTNGVTVVGHVDLSDPDHRVPWTIVNFFTRQRLLTGADFDPESMQQAPDGTFWLGDEFGPFLLHVNRNGTLLETPIAEPGLRSPQSPDLEEAQGVRVMDALRQHAQQSGSATPIVSPDFNLLVDNNPATNVASRAAPPAGSGVPAASSEILTVATLHTAGFKVVPYTVDTAEAIDAVLRLGVDGIISDNSDLLHQRLAAFDANGDGVPGDYLLPDGRVDRTKFDAEGHRGSRGLRPENTLPAFEAGLDNLMNTMETDTGITRDGVPVISHDPFLDPTKCRNADGSQLPGQILIRDLTARQIQRDFVCDETLPAFPRQSNDTALSPVAVAYARTHHIAAYAKPRLQDLFDFAAFYATWFSTGPGRHDAGAAVKAANARTVHFNVETKLNPVPALASRTVSAEAFERIDDGLIARNHLERRVTLQSFDWRTLLLAQRNHPRIATVALWGDSPIFADPTIAGSGDGGNLQPVGGNTPWLGGLVWPWRQTLATLPARVQASGGFEAMAISPDGRTLYPVTEKPLVGPATTTALIAQFDLRSRSFTGTTWQYPYAAGGISVPDLQLYAPGRGVAIERDNSTGTTNGLKEVFAVSLPAGGGTVTKTPVADLLHVADPAGIARRDRFAQPGDLVGDPGQFAMPYVTIEAVVVRDRRTLVIVNDNNYPFSIGRHVGTQHTDDNDVVALRLSSPLPG
jgi:glycerophosphoryl diester phosphodiesterase